MSPDASNPTATVNAAWHWLVVLVVWAAIYLPGLGALEIKGEEGRRILPAVAMLESGNYLVPQVGSEPYFRKPPLINWLVAASFKLTGAKNEWTARLPSVLCVLAVALAFVTIARRALGAHGSLIAALIWMTNFGMIEKGRLIELEALYVSLTGLAFICWLSWREERRSPWLTWTVPWVFLGFGMLAKGPVHLVFFYAVVLAILWREKKLRALFCPAHLIGLLLMLGIFAAWAIPCLFAMREGNVTGVWAQQFSGRLTGEDFKFSGWILNIPRGLGYFLPWTVLVFFGRRGALFGSEKGVPSGLLWGIAISFLAVSLIPGSLARYTMPLLVPAAWLAALLLRERHRLVFVMTAVICAAMLIYGFAAVPFLRQREKVRNIAAQINAALPAGVPLYAIDPDYQPAFFYVRDPIVYLSRVADAPEGARFLLVQPADEAEALRGGRALVRVRDYRKKEVIVVERVPAP